MNEPEAAHLPLAPPRVHRDEVRTGFRSSHLTPAKVSSASSPLGKRAAGSKAQPKAKTDRAWDPTPIHPDKTPKVPIKRPKIGDRDLKTPWKNGKMSLENMEKNLEK